MQSSARPLKITQNQGEIERPIQPFDEFLRTAFSTLIAVVLAWRLFIFPTNSQKKETIRDGLVDEEMEPQVPGPSSLLSMLSTDNIPSSSSSDGEDRPPPPLPCLVQTSVGLGYLDAIEEEESDDLRSISSASFASPRTVIDTSADRTQEQANLSGDLEESEKQHSPIVSPYRQQVDLTFDDHSVPSDSREQSPLQVTIIENPADTSTESIKEKGDEVDTNLLKGLVNLSKTQQDTASVSSDRPLLEQMLEESQSIGNSIDRSMKRFHEQIQNNAPKDADRDQTEELVYQEEQKPVHAMDDSQSLASVSFSLDQSRDSVLDTSQPIDELAIVQQMSGNRPPMPPPSPPLDLPPPPPPLIPFNAPLKVIRYSPPPPPVAPPPPPPPPIPLPISPKSTSTTPVGFSSEDRNGRRHVSSSGSHSSSSHHSSHSTHSQNSQVGPGTIPSGISQLKKTSEYESNHTSHYSRYSGTKNGDLEVDIDNAMRRAARYGQTYGDAPKSHMQTSADDRGMSSPPFDAPPPPPSYHSSHHPAAPESTQSYSREDLLSDIAAPSRSTVREIPVQRAVSAAPSHSTAVTGMEYRTPLYDRGDGQDEYYRREVISRTIITRSSETLSQQPPVGRSSPIERYISYPDPNTRETKEIEYRVNVTRNVEEEERRIREAQERRRKEEDDRRRRDDAARREWEKQEQEHLERVRREWERKERELETHQEIREREEKERIERDRKEREEQEMLRRKDWERRENERRTLEEQELERTRKSERERLEKIKLEEERRERERLEREKIRLEKERQERERIEMERLERERIERERIERERIEIERIERIKRERIEREKQEREKEREEQLRLQKEREELERLERERRDLERKERELREIERREAEARERERREDEAREAKRREEERYEAELLLDIQRKAEERERLRRLQEQEELNRLENIRREQERREKEKHDFERRERERQEEERREQELLNEQRRQREKRDLERLEDERREKQRQDEERRERERREKERRDAQERERIRQLEEIKERERTAALDRIADERNRQRQSELDREKERAELERRALELKELERREAERRELERVEEERQLLTLKEKERRNQEIRERERREALAREEARRKEDSRSRDRLDMLVREKTEKERFEIEKRRLLEEKERRERKKFDLTSPETLGKLVRPPYFSRENLSGGTEYTTKVERQVIERVDRNVYVDDQTRSYPFTSVSSGTQAIGYRDSPLDTTTEEERRERMYSTRQDDLNRSNSARTSRYRTKMLEKAKREFLTGQPEPSQADSDRWQRSQEDMLRPRPEMRGPLLQKFHSGEFSSKPQDLNLPYSRVGPSQYGQEFDRLLEETERKYAIYRNRMSQPNLYSRQRHYSTSYLETDVDTGRPDMATDVRQVEETNLDDVHHRSGSVVDYHRQSRRDITERQEETSHTRSKSADYLMDRRTREETEPPENELQKMAPSSPRNERISEHELRFRKSVEKLQVPDWYRENRQTGRATDIDSTLPRGGYTSTHTHVEEWGRPTTTQSHYHGHSSHTHQSPVGGIDLPKGMFDKYRNEIEDLRRSMTSLHVEAPQQPRQEEQFVPRPAPRRSLSQEVVSQRVQNRQADRQASLPGYTVTEIPESWNMIRSSHHSRVVEVADTFAGPKKFVNQLGQVSLRYGGRVTLEEVLDSIFQQKSNLAMISQNDSSLPQADTMFKGNDDGPSIYTKNYMLMDQVMQQPERAEQLLKSEKLFVRCSHCHRTRELARARLAFVSCKHCYSYYCSRQCRLNDWQRHQGRCSFARINTLCKDVIMKVREDPQAQLYMSKIAREGYAARGRGSVNIRLASPQQALSYVTHGWQALAGNPVKNLLFYYTVAALIQERKEPSLITLCRQYDPNEKFILSVSIIADIEHCPQTPPPETVDFKHYEYPPSQPIGQGATPHFSPPQIEHDTISKHQQQEYTDNLISYGTQPGISSLVPTDV